MSEALGSIASLSGQAGVTGTGLYLLTGVSDHVGESGQSCLRLTLEDATGRTLGFVWPEYRPHLACPATPAPVTVTGLVQIFQNHAQLKVQTLAPLDGAQVPSATALCAACCSIPPLACPFCAAAPASAITTPRSADC